MFLFTSPVYFGDMMWKVVIVVVPGGAGGGVWGLGSGVGFGVGSGFGVGFGVGPGFGVGAAQVLWHSASPVDPGVPAGTSTQLYVDEHRYAGGSGAGVGGAGVRTVHLS